MSSAVVCIGQGIRVCVDKQWAGERGFLALVPKHLGSIPCSAPSCSVTLGKSCLFPVPQFPPCSAGVTVLRSVGEGRDVMSAP